MFKYIFTFILIISLISSLVSKAQKTAEIEGVITNEKGIPLENVNIIIKDFAAGTVSLSNGNYKINVPLEKKITLQFTHLNYKPFKKSFFLQTNRKTILNVELVRSNEELTEVKIEAQIRGDNVVRIDIGLLNRLPVTVSGAVEGLVKGLHGVNSNNELSSQYSVRGGNFDENLVYVNDVEIYRPLLIRSGQQEGLSFTNPDLVSSIQFSSGGFDAKYGDKMSSVLDIKYKTPVKFEASGAVSLLGMSAHFANRSPNGKLSYMAGIRYKTNSYLLSSLDTKGDYSPRYTDYQALVNYRFNDTFSLHFMGSISKNRYFFKPENRETSFGTISSALQLHIFFDGQEEDEYITDLEALTLKYRPNSNNLIKLIACRYQSKEEESFDILGQYFLNELFETQQGPSDESLENLGVGTYLDHARNKLKLDVNTLSLKGSHSLDNWFLQWGVGVKHERINDVINEWQYLDSAGYSIPYSETQVLLTSIRNTENRIQINHLTSFLQGTYSLETERGKFKFVGGLRYHYWDYTKENIVSPRFSINYLPDWENKAKFRFSTGYYQQAPSYREMLTINGSISANQTIQKSVHYVLGQEYYFSAYNRPFKFSTEIYYKQLQTLIPYEIENVRLRYYGDQESQGYATGIDLRVNGEFVPGTESWASLSVMKTEENIKGDELGYIPRPTDQRVNFSVYFQDYLPRNPSYKMQLNLVYGGRLPFWMPEKEKQGTVLKMPPYRRVDIGFSKIIIDPTKDKKHSGMLKYFKSLWIKVEIFNVLDINNTISYLWIKDVKNSQYAVPNYLTSRKFNFKLNARF